MDKSHNLRTSIAFCFIVLVVSIISEEIKAQNPNPPSMNSPNAAQSQPVAPNGVVLLDKKLGFPIIINQPGSFSLKSNLTVPANTNGIVIQADNVTIDLNGFNITGNGSGDGITDNGVAHTAIAIHNGTIVNFDSGINLISSNQIDVEQIRALNNQHAGITVGEDSIVSGNIVSGSHSFGIVTGGFSLISRNIASTNQGSGIGASASSTVIDNTTSLNSGNGIEASFDCTISGNTASQNGGIGIEATNGVDSPNQSTISGNTADNNGTAGIHVNCPANLVGNTVLENASDLNNISLVGSGCTRANNNPAP